MGGVAAVVSPKAGEALEHMLRALAHRGDAGTGVALVDGELVIEKLPVDATTFLSRVSVSKLGGKMGIGQVRFATHGRPSLDNTQPFSDCKRLSAVALDGVIDDYERLSNELKRRGHVLVSRCDAEIVAHVVEDSLTSELSPLEIGQKILELPGYFACAVLLARERKIVVVRKGPSIWCGIGDSITAVASESDALRGLCSRVAEIPDEHICILSESGIGIFNRDGTPAEVSWTSPPEPSPVPGGFSHFMEREILETPDAISRTLITQQSRYLRLAARLLHNARNIYAIGCGSSYYAALLWSYMMSELAETPIHVVPATEFRFYALPDVRPGDVVVAISQSGRTADVIRSVHAAKMHGAVILSVINELGSPLMHSANVYLPVGAGKENAIPATKSFVCTLVTLMKLTLAVAREKGHDTRTWEEMLLKLPDLVRRAIEMCRERCREVAKHLVKTRHAFVLSRGILYALALEGALKLKEASQIHAEGINTGELRHGPLALLGPDVTCIFIMPHETEAREDSFTLMREARDAGAGVVAITDTDDVTSERITDLVIKVPSAEKWFRPIVYAPAVQLLAYYIGAMRGLNPDRPQRLRKYVVT